MIAFQFSFMENRNGFSMADDLSRPPSLRWPLEGPAFWKAVWAVPQIDLDYCRQMASTKLTDLELRVGLVRNRWGNPICEGCCQKDPETITRLNRCTRCFLSAYCSKDCQRKMWPQHRERCNNPNGPLDDGPQAIVFLKLDSPGRA